MSDPVPPSEPAAGLEGRSDRPRSPAREWLVILAIVIVGLSLRLQFLSDWAAVPSFWSLWGDELNFHQTAQALIDPAQNAPPFLYQPLYAFYLAGVYSLIGVDPAGAHHLQLLWAALTILLAALLGREMAGRWGGRIAALLAAGYGPLIFLEGSLLDPAINLPLLSLSLLFLLQSERGGFAWRLPLSGLAAGLVTMGRPNFAFCLPVAALWIWRRAWPRRRRLAGLALAAAGIWLGLAPAWIHNLRRGEASLPVSSAGGISFYIGNNPQATGLYHVPKGERIDAGSHEAYRRSLRLLAEKAEGRPLDESEVSGYWFGQGLRFWKEHPLSALRLAALKLLWAVNREEAPIHHPFPFGREVSGLLRWLIGFGVVFPFALLGAALGRPRDSRVWLLAGCAAAYLATLVLFYVADRYRILLMPMLWPLAARGMLALGDRLRLGWRAAAGSLALLGGASLLAQLPLMSEAQQKNSIASSYNLQGKIEGDVGHLDRAERYFRLAIAHSAPGTGSLARSNLGRLYELRGDEKEAERWYREAVEINPESRQALQRLAALSERRGDIGAALRWWEHLAEVSADDSTAQKQIARLRALSSEAPPP